MSAEQATIHARPTHLDMAGINSDHAWPSGSRSGENLRAAHHFTQRVGAVALRAARQVRSEVGATASSLRSRFNRPTEPNTPHKRWPDAELEYQYQALEDTQRFLEREDSENFSFNFKNWQEVDRLDAIYAQDEQLQPDKRGATAIMTRFYHDEHWLETLAAKQASQGLSEREQARVLDLIADQTTRLDRLNDYYLPLTGMSLEESEQRKRYDHDRFLAEVQDSFGLNLRQADDSQEEQATSVRLEPEVDPNHKQTDDNTVRLAIKRPTVRTRRSSRRTETMRRSGERRKIGSAVALGALVMLGSLAYRSCDDEDAAPDTSTTTTTSVDDANKIATSVTSSEQAPTTPTTSTTLPSPPSSTESPTVSQTETERIRDDFDAQLANIEEGEWPWEVVEDVAAKNNLPRQQVTPALHHAVQAYNRSRQAHEPEVLYHHLKNSDFWLSIGRDSSTESVMRALEPHLTPYIAEANG